MQGIFAHIIGAIFTIISASLFLPVDAYAQEKFVDDFAVNFGIISWEEIQKGIREKPAAHAEDYHLKMAREMAKMHKGGKKGTHHVLVVISDKSTGKRIDKADVRVLILPESAFKKDAIKLQPMAMNGYAGFGEFVTLRSKRSHIFKVFFRLSEREAYKEADFVKTFY